MSNFIQKAIKHPGRMKRAAARAGESTHEFMEEHKGAKGGLGSAARLGLRLEGMHHAGMRDGGMVASPAAQRRFNRQCRNKTPRPSD